MALAALAWAAGAAAQALPLPRFRADTPATAAPAAPEPAPPAVVPDAQLLPRSLADAARLRLLTRSAEAVRTIEDIERDLPAVEAELRELRDAYRANQGRLRIQRLVDDYQRAVWAQQAKLDRWERNLVAQTSAALAGRDTVAAVMALWRATRDRPGADLPPVARERIGELLTFSTSVDSSLRRRVVALTTIHERVQAQAFLAIVLLDQFEATMAASRRTFFRIDRAPLWRTSAMAGKPATSAWTEELRALPSFLSAYGPRLVLHGLLTLVLLAGMLRLRTVGRRMQDETTVWESTLRVLARPFSAALLLGMAATVVLYPYAPTALVGLVLVLMIPPLLRLMPAFVRPSVRPAIATVAVVAGITEVAMLPARTELAERLVLLGTALAALPAFAVAQRRLAEAAAAPEPAPTIGAPPAVLQVALRVTQVALLLLAVAIGSNLVGNVTLADALIRGTLTGTYLALVLYATLVVANASLATLLRTTTARHLHLVRGHPDAIRLAITRLLWLLAAFGLVYGTLTAFAIGDAAWEWLSSSLTREWTIGTVTITIGSILAFVATLWGSVLLARLLRFVLDGEVFPRVDLPRGLAATVSTMVGYGVVTLGFLLALGATGVELSKFSLLAGALGVGVGFGLQNVVGNFVSGIILALERPVQVGDTIQVGTCTGTVSRIGFRSSAIQTFDGAEVIVPNGDLIAREVTNWTLTDRRRRVELPVGVAYGTDPQRVIDLLVQTARANPLVLGVPEPFALFQGFGASSLDFLLRFWIADFGQSPTVRSEVAVAVHGALTAAGIEIPFPQQDLHVRSVAPAARAALGSAEPPA